MDQALIDHSRARLVNSRVIRGEGTARHGWYPEADDFDYQDTEHPCPSCGQALTLVSPSAMLVCINTEHGPYYLT